VSRRVQRGPDAIEQLLQSVGQEALADQDDGEKRHNPPTRPTDRLDDRHEDCGDEHEFSPSELGDHLQHVVRESCRVVVDPG
jgi:hypothetical protein